MRVVVSKVICRRSRKARSIPIGCLGMETKISQTVMVVFVFAYKSGSSSYCICAKTIRDGFHHVLLESQE
jgi:hypothetical protein